MLPDDEQEKQRRQQRQRRDGDPSSQREAEDPPLFWSEAELARIVGTSTIWRPFVPQRVILNEAIGARRPIHSYGWRAADSIAAFDELWPHVALRAR